MLRVETEFLLAHICVVLWFPQLLLPSICLRPKGGRSDDEEGREYRSGICWPEGTEMMHCGVEAGSHGAGSYRQLEREYGGLWARRGL